MRPSRRARSTAAATPSRHGSPWPGSTVSAAVAASASSEASAWRLSAVAARATICGPVEPVYGFSVTRASPATSAPRSGMCNAHCPCDDRGRRRRLDDRHVEHTVRAVRVRIVHALYPERARSPHGREHLHEARIPAVRQPAALVVVAPGVADEGKLALVRPDGYFELRARSPSKSDVVEVPVREHDRLDVRRRSSQRPQRLVQRSPRARVAGVDDGEAGPVLDDEPVDVRVLDEVDAVRGVRLEHAVPVPERMCAKPLEQSAPRVPGRQPRA